MKRREETENTLRATNFGSSLDKLEGGDLERGYFDAGPKGNYESSLEHPDNDGALFPVSRGGTRHAGHIEPDGYYKMHGTLDQWGFVRRPNYKTDVERN